MYIVAGPVKIGNIFGSFGLEVPENKFAIVEDGEYSNGGYGPSQVVNGLFSTTVNAEVKMEEVVRAREEKNKKAEEREKEGRKQFARDQIAYLVILGFSQGAAYRIMKAAGPGQVKKAIEWIREAYERLASCEEGESGAADALDCILTGMRGSHSFGKDRMASALRAIGLPIPDCQTAKTFFGVLAGAKAALLSGILLYDAQKKVA